MTTKVEQTHLAVVKRDNPFALDTGLKPVPWKEMRERFAPIGEERKAKDLVDTTFTIRSFKPVESSLSTVSDHFYFCICTDEDGALFHTTLGGQAVVDVLDDFDRLRTAYLDALQLGDDERRQELLALGAMSPITVTLRKVSGGRFGGYYTFD